MSSEKTVGIEYSKPKIGKRALAVLIDGACLIMTTLILFLALMQGTMRIPLYAVASSSVDDVRLASHLYQQKEDGDIALITDIYSDSSEYAYDAQNRIYSTALTYFFGLDSKEKGDYVFFSEGAGIKFYNSQKGARTDLFVKVSDDQTDPDMYAQSQFASDKSLAEFYTECVENSTGFLSNVEAYSQASSTMFWSALITGIICYLISYLIWFLAVPFGFRRGFKTLGMAAARYGKVYVDGLNMTAERFLLRFLFSFLTLGIGFVAFFIPLAVSVTFTYFGQFSQSLPDYLANVYPVSTEKDQIYFTPTEYKNAIIQGKIILSTDLSAEQKESKKRDQQDRGD